VKLVPLTQGMYAQVDDADFEIVSKFKWHYAKPEAARSGYAYRYVPPNSTQSLHRFIMGEPAGYMVDHRDTDGLNNQRHNLRLCNNSQNKMNMPARRDSRFGIKGVYWASSKRRWRAIIAANHWSI
jgi:hypothetical protein